MTEAAPFEAQATGKARRIGFYVVVGLALALMASFAIGFPPILTMPVTGWLGDAAFDRYVGEEGAAIHRLHGLAFSLVIWMVLIGLVTQLRRPQGAQAPLWAAAAVTVTVLVLETALVGFDPFSLVLVALLTGSIALHPRRLPEDGVSWSGTKRIVAGVAAVAAVIYAFGQARLQIVGVEADPHVAEGHYAFMAVLAVSLAIALLLGASNLTGARIAAWTAGVMGVLLGAMFIAFPDVASSGGVGWGVVAVLIGLAYLGLVAARRPTPASG